MHAPLEVAERHTAHRETVREFCESRIEPRVQEFEERGEFPTELVREVGNADLGGVPYPATSGGAGLDYRSFAITIEELARAWKLLAGTINVNCGLVGYPIQTFGTDWQRSEWLSDVLAGEAIGALSMTEPEAGSDARGIRTTARRSGDGLVIDGTKVWTTNGEIADLIVVLARTGEEAGGDLSLIGIPDPAEREGVEFVRNIPSLEGEAAIETEVRYDDVWVPEDNVIGEPGRGFRYVMEALDIGRIGTAAQGVGVAQAAFEASRDFADEREQFGRPIREFQGIGFKVADMATDVEAARLLTLAAANDRDRGRRVTRRAAMAKVHATDTAMDAAIEAIQIHGSRGYSKDLPVERYMRVAKGMQIYEGTNEINRLVITNRLYEE